MFRPVVQSGQLHVAASAAVALSLGAVHAATLNVPAGFPTIQAAVNAAVDGDEVVVATGTYNNTSVLINGKSITLRSAANVAQFCVINSPAAISVSVLGAGENCVIRGFTLRNGLRGVEVNAGASATVEKCTIENMSIGGMFMNGTSLTLRDSTIRNNATANAGGGILITLGEVLIRNCSFVGNDVTGFNAFGGAVHVAGNVSLTIVDSAFVGNTAVGNNSGRGGALYATGGGGSGITIMNTLFDDNEANERGGGLYVEFRDLVLGTVEVTDNTALAGGGMFLENLAGAPNNLLISNSLIANNQATNGSGGGIRQAQDSKLTVSNATIMGNTSSGAAGGGVANGPNSTATFTNCIVGGSSPDDFAGVGTTVVTYSNVEDGFVGEGNIAVLPLFVDAAAGNYHLAAGSPCIDAGSTLAFTGPSMDLDGQRRIVDDADSDDTGFALANGAIDMGAYEFQPVDSCPADVDGDGSVDVDDLLSIITSWGVCP